MLHLFHPPSGCEIVTSVDTLTVGVHFTPDSQANDIGYKSLAISLSDLAAMGAQASAVLLALTLPEANEDWLTQFASGFFALADEYNIELIGGNISRGPLSISTTTFGWVNKGQALRRNGAKIGDEIYVTGTLGTAGLALQLQQKRLPLDAEVHQRFFRPQPRLEAGLALRQIAHAVIDISDGLAADLQKLLTASFVGGSIEIKLLPLAKSVKTHCSEEEGWKLALTAGEDYELCFCAPPSKKEQLKAAFAAIKCPVHCIGEVNTAAGLKMYSPAGKLVTVEHLGYQHF